MAIAATMNSMQLGLLPLRTLLLLYPGRTCPILTVAVTPMGPPPPPPVPRYTSPPPALIHTI